MTDGHHTPQSLIKLLFRLTIECKSLHDLVQKLEDANSKLEADCLRSASSASPTCKVRDYIIPSKTRPKQLSIFQDVQTLAGDEDRSARLEADNSKLEQSLEEAEGKIAGLLQVKEKLVNVQVRGIPVKTESLKLFDTDRCKTGK